jgi:hypothetical protein
MIERRKQTKGKAGYSLNRSKRAFGLLLIVTVSCEKPYQSDNNVMQMNYK